MASELENSDENKSPGGEADPRVPVSAPDAEPTTAAPSTSSPSAQTGSSGGIWPFFRERYFSMDRRLLGLFRIYFGFLLLIDVLRRLPDVTFFYTNEGILPNHFALYAPMAKPMFSIYTAFSTKPEVVTAFLLTALVYVFYIVGYRTKITQILAVILASSLNSRNLFVENGGCVTVVIVAAWTMFLPLGDRFSVDALLKSLRARREHKASALNDRSAITPDGSPHISLIMLGLLTQLSVIYFFNCVQKTDIAWRQGETIHWVLWQNRIATTLCSLVRMHEPSWLSPLLCWVTLIIEGGAPLFLFFPFGYRYIRSMHVLAFIGLHGSIAMLMTLGPFSYVMIGLNCLMIPAVWLDGGARFLRKGKTARTVVYEPTDPGLHAVARILARLDTFELLTFVDRNDATATESLTDQPDAVFATLDSSGKWHTGTDGIVDALRSTPMGTVLAGLFGSFLIKPLLRVALLRRAHLSEVYTLEPGVSESESKRAFDLLPEPSPMMKSWVGVRSGLREGAAGFFFFLMLSQIAHDNWWLRGKIPDALRNGPPAALAPLVLYPRLLQGWSMFAHAPRDDGTVVVDAVMANGQHIDPLTGKAPDLDAPLHGPWFQSQLFCDYFLKIHFDGNKGYREDLKKYILSWQRLEGRPANDRIVSFDVYWVSCDSPPPGQTEPRNIKRTLIASSKQ
ncbi:MAG: HTTM domain-containing protein [Polyangiaceae bacterium]